jgi:hypothetical protein
MAINISFNFDNFFDESSTSVSFNKYLLNKIQFFGFNCLQMAYAGGIRNFMAQSNVQRLLDDLWFDLVSNKDGLKSYIYVN